MVELAAVGVLVPLVVALRRWLCVVTVRGDSMAPAYRDGDRLLVARSRRRVRAGSVIVFVPPAGVTDVPWLVKRVAGPDDDPRSGRFIVRGDAAVSLDSRHFGPVSRDAVIGVVVRRLNLRVSGRGRGRSALVFPAMPDDRCTPRQARRAGCGD